MKTAEVSQIARDLVEDLEPNLIARGDPDEILMAWVEAEKQLFFLAESDRFGLRVQAGYIDMNDFVSTALSVINTRKSRAGRALEHHFAALLKMSRIPFDTQQKTEGKAKPDFIFPSISAYRDPIFPARSLRMVATKTSCKDRWRQILPEARRIRKKHLLTLEAPVSPNQLDEMERTRVQLVVPRPLHDTFPPTSRTRLLSVRQLLKLLA